MSAHPSLHRARPLALSAVWLPLVTIHLCYLVSAFQGHVDWCLPYAEPCTSISRAGRHGLAYFIFKGGMLPGLVLLAMFWWLNSRWLALLGSNRGRLLPVLGLVASLALLVYTLSLGHEGDSFRVLRRAGVMAYFGLTFVSQLQLGAALAALPLQASRGRRLVALSGATLGVGLCSLLVSLVSPGLGNELEDVFEWWLVLLLNVHALLVARFWRLTGFGLALRVDGNAVSGSPPEN